MEFRFPDLSNLKIEGNDVFQAQLDLLIQNNALLNLILENQITDRYAESDLQNDEGKAKADEVKKQLDDRYSYFLQNACIALSAKYAH